jgi:hypothetical protein
LLLVISLDIFKTKTWHNQFGEVFACSVSHVACQNFCEVGTLEQKWAITYKKAIDLHSDRSAVNLQQYWRNTEPMDAVTQTITVARPSKFRARAKLEDEKFLAYIFYVLQIWPTQFITLHFM